jgi:hypothetical protein
MMVISYVENYVVPPPRYARGRISEMRAGFLNRRGAEAQRFFGSIYHGGTEVTEKKEWRAKRANNSSVASVPPWCNILTLRLCASAAHSRIAYDGVLVRGG